MHCLLIPCKGLNSFYPLRIIFKTFIKFNLYSVMDMFFLSHLLIYLIIYMSLGTWLFYTLGYPILLHFVEISPFLDTGSSFHLSLVSL